MANQNQDQVSAASQPAADTTASTAGNRQTIVCTQEPAGHAEQVEQQQQEIRNTVMKETQAPATVDDAPEDQGGPAAAINNPAASTALPCFDPPGFNLGQFRIDQNFAEHAGGEKLLTTIPVRKPSKEAYVRTHPDANYRLATPLIELKEQGELYLVFRQLWPELMDEPTFVAMRDLAMRGGPYTAEERAALLAYCESDVIALERLLPALLPHIDLPRALIRGEYMAALAHVEWRGMPIDTLRWGILKAHWQETKLALIQRIDRNYGVYDGLTFKLDRFGAWLRANRIVWPTLESGQLALDEDTFREMAKLYPEVGALKELRSTIGQLRLNELPVGQDGRNRCLLSPFASRTGRNQPSNSRFIFGPAVWIRNLIKPAPGHAVAYIDWEQQEFGIAGALSGDTAMMTAYASGDPYLAFAKQAGAVPAGATKKSHRVERELFKNCALAVQYGMGELSLGSRLGLGPAHGRELIGKHQSTYPRFWRWAEAVQDHAMFRGDLHATFGWRVQVGRNANPRSLRNFVAQANGAEMLRLAIILAHRAGVEICAPVHDALLIEAPSEEIDDAVATCQRAMQQASELVLPGFPLRTEAKIVRAPGRYSDERGAKLWAELWEIPALKEALQQIENENEQDGSL